MKEIYDWVPWFKELSTRVAENGEAFLVERAKQLPWKEDGTNPALLNYGDPQTPGECTESRKHALAHAYGFRHLEPGTSRVRGGWNAEGVSVRRDQG